MADRRLYPPSLPEIKEMDVQRLFLEIARMQVGLVDIHIKFQSRVSDLRPLHKAKDSHEKALHRLVGELSARYVAETEARQAFLFRLVAKVATRAKACDSFEVGTPEWNHAYEKLQRSLTDLEALR